MALVRNILRTVVLVSSISSLVVACAPQGSMRSYRYDLAKYKAIQEKLHKQLDAEADARKAGETDPNLKKEGSPNGDEQVEVGPGTSPGGDEAIPTEGGTTPPEGGTAGTGTEAGGDDSTAPVTETTPDVNGQIISEVIEEQFEGKLTLDALEKLFDASKAQNAVLGFAASVTKLEGKMDIAFQAVAAPNNNNAKEFAGVASPALEKVGIANKILFSEVTGAETDGDVKSSDLTGTLLCKDAACDEMVGMLVVSPKLLVVFKMDSSGKVEGPFKTFAEAKDELDKANAAADANEGKEGDATTQGDGTQGDGTQGDATTQGDGTQGDATTQGDGTQGDATTQGDGTQGDATTQGDGTQGDATTQGDGTQGTVGAGDPTLGDTAAADAAAAAAKEKVKQYEADRAADADLAAQKAAARANANSTKTTPVVATTKNAAMEHAVALFKAKQQRQAADAELAAQKAAAAAETQVKQPRQAIQLVSSSSKAAAETQVKQPRQAIELVSSSSKAAVETQVKQPRQAIELVSSSPNATSKPDNTTLKATFGGPR